MQGDREGGGGLPAEVCAIFEMTIGMRGPQGHRDVIEGKDMYSIQLLGCDDSLDVSISPISLSRGISNRNTSSFHCMRESYSRPVPIVRTEVLSGCFSPYYMHVFAML